MSNKMSIFPNSLTVGNMFFGFLSVISSIEGDYKWAAYYVVLGAICDLLDGKVARLVKSTSDFGVEFDSLSDLITFGMAPSMLIYSLYKHIYILPPALKDLDHLFIIFSFFPLMFTGIRLARFNAELVGHDKEVFSGLPSPASALTIISFVLYQIATNPGGKILHLEWLGLIIVLVSYLMLSRITYHGFPKIFVAGENVIIRFSKIFLILLALIAIVKFNVKFFFPIMVLFVLLGVARNMYESFRSEIRKEKE